jgi:hypothetical protein
MYLSKSFAKNALVQPESRAAYRSKGLSLRAHPPAFLRQSLQDKKYLPCRALQETPAVRMIEKTYAKILAEKRRDFIERGTPSFSESRVR